MARSYGLQRQISEAHAILDEVEPQLNDEMPVARVRYHLERGRTLNSSGEQEASPAHFLAAWEEAVSAKAEFFAVDAAYMMAIVAEPAGQISWNEKALAYAEASALPRARNWLGSLYNNLGWTYHEMGDFERALELFHKALEFNIEKEHPDRIRIAKWSVGRCLRSMGRLAESPTIQLTLEAGDETGYVFEELGELLLLQNQASEAQPYFAKAYQLLSQDPWLQANEEARLARLKVLGGVRSGSV